MRSWGLARFSAFGLSAIFVAGILASMGRNYVLASYVFFCVIDVLLYSHYVLAFSSKSVRQRFFAIAKTPSGAVSLLALLLLSLACIFYEPELVAILFGFHFALSEVYSRVLIDKSSFFSSTNLLHRLFRFVHFSFLSIGYFYAIVHTLSYAERLSPLSAVLRKDFLLLAFLFSAVAYFSMFIACKKRLFPEMKNPSSGLKAYLLPELIFVPTVFLLHDLRMHWSTLVIYHLVFWIVFPLFKPQKKEAPSAMALFFKGSLIPTLCLSVVFFFLYPKFMTGSIASSEFLVQQGYINDSSGGFLGYHPRVFTEEGILAYNTTMSWGIVHIMFSLVLSALNPRRLRELWT